MNKENKIRGVTLVALVITIIILLLLAGIVITQLTGDNGLFVRAKQAKNNTLDAQNAENMTIEDYENKIDEVVGSRDTVTISKDEYDKLKNANVFSENEIEIGTWIDGKKVYRKVVKGTVVAGETAFSQEGVTSGKNIVNYYGELKAQDGNWINVDYLGSASLYWNTPTSGLKWAVGVNAYTGGEYQLVVEYTKTTD